jgi:hypothetical protein
MRYDPSTGAQASQKRRRVSGTFTRPADTTAYTAGDAVNNSTTAPTLLTLSDVVNGLGGTGKIVEIMLVTNNATVTNGTFRVYIFNASYTPQADNAVATGVAGHASSLQGYADLPILTADAAGSTSAVTRVNEKVAGGDDGVPMQFACAATDNDLYALIVATGAYTPASGQSFTLSLVVEPD